MNGARILTMIDIWFFLLAFLTLFGALSAILSKKSMHSAIGLLVTSMSLAGFYLLLDAKFLFMAQIIVYVGAVITLILMILMFLNVDDSQMPGEGNRFLKIGFGIMIMLPFDFIILEELSKLPVTNSIQTTGSLKLIGESLFSNWLIPFELISVLLLVALIGAIILAKKISMKGVE
jgi:NADH-quinone oxidoreductase subunit J